MEFCVQVKRFGLKLKYNARCNAKYEVTNYEHKCLQSVTPLLHCSAMMCHCLAPPTQYTVANCSNTRVHFIGDVGLPIVYRYNACLRKLIPADSVFFVFNFELCWQFCEITATSVARLQSDSSACLCLRRRRSLSILTR